MEQLLAIYAQDYDERYPVVCFDERPCFLIGDRVEVLAMKAGSIKKENYSYTKHGSCALFAAIEPKTGLRLAEVYGQRRKVEFAEFCQAIAKKWPKAKKIRLVLDNLNTHFFSAFYENMLAADAFELAQRFEFIYTPKSASWLNMIEIEFSALSRLCLNRRIPDIDILRKEISTFFMDRQLKTILINWQFSIQSARLKLSRHYQSISPQNTIPEC